MIGIHNSCESIVDYLLLKAAARCNIACAYCYWFRDPAVYEKPKVMDRQTFRMLSQRIDTHIRKFSIPRFSVLFHGGEPLLCRKADFEEFCSSLRSFETSTGCVFKLDVTTNGLLIDSDWISYFKTFGVGVTISIDGPAASHDRFRVDFNGHGTFDRVIRAISFLRENGIEPGILSVCNPQSDPQDLFDVLVHELHFSGFDILIPDATHNDRPSSIADYYCRLFDLWYDEYDHQGVRIRILDNMLLGLFGGFSESESIGFGPIRRLTILTDGSMETLDVLRVIAPGFTSSDLNIFNNDLQEIERNPLWQEVLRASVSLAPSCIDCSFMTACGGGHIATRWSTENRFDNPSVYCSDIKCILRHIWSRIAPTLYLTPRSATIPADQA